MKALLKQLPGIGVLLLFRAGLLIFDRKLMLTNELNPVLDKPAIPETFQAKKSYLTSYFDNMAEVRDHWISKNQYYHHNIERLVYRLVRPNSSVLVLGSGTGDMLQALKANPSTSLGLDISPAMVKRAEAKYPKYRFQVGDAENLKLSLIDNSEVYPEKFDYIVMSDVVGYLEDIEKCFRNLHPLCHLQTRLIITYYNMLWEPLLKVAEKVALKMPQETQNWLSMNDLKNMLYLADFEIEQAHSALLIPKKIPLIGSLLNLIAPHTPLLKELCLVQYFSARFRPPSQEQLRNRDELSVSVIIPCRNEVGNIESGVELVPRMGKHTEIVFVDGNSNDGTVEKIEEVITKYQGQKDIRLIHQIPRQSILEQSEEKRPDKMLKLGKGDAVRKGFDAAKGDVLMILDADLTVAPADLPKFFLPLADGKAGFVNGCRLVYPMENEAMRFVNLCGNKAFSLAFSWLLGQPIKDTLCGTKVLLKKDYEIIKANRSYFGEFDPFGDFDLLFGAARLKYRLVDMPIRYRRRVSGESKVSVIKHGILLLKMTVIGFQKFKWNRWIGLD
jgi:glycosyltransferase involved in cell wall biosynthesis/ubiquinone/menaquinone biosynthesis C-methylase UbiE